MKKLFLSFIFSGLLLCHFAPEVAAQDGKPRPLVADKDHEVMVCKECDLAIRFSKKTFVPVYVYHNKGESYFTSVKPLRSFRIYEDFSAISTLRPKRVITVECFRHQQLPNADLDDLFFSRKFREENHPKQWEISREDFRKEVGLEPVSFSQTASFSKWRVKNEKEGQEDFFVFFWGTKDFSWLLSEKPGPGSWINNRSTGEPRIDWMIQMNSVCPSKPSIDLDDPKNEFYSW